MNNIYIIEENNKFFISIDKNEALCDEDTCIELEFDEKIYRRLARKHNAKYYRYYASYARSLIDTYFLQKIDIENFIKELKQIIKK